MKEQPGGHGVEAVAPEGDPAGPRRRDRAAGSGRRVRHSRPGLVRVRRHCAAGGPARGGESKSGGRSSCSPRVGGGRRVCHGAPATTWASGRGHRRGRGRTARPPTSARTRRGPPRRRDRQGSWRGCGRARRAPFGGSTSPMRAAPQWGAGRRREPGARRPRCSPLSPKMVGLRFEAAAPQGRRRRGGDLLTRGRVGAGVGAHEPGRVDEGRDAGGQLVDEPDGGAPLGRVRPRSAGPWRGRAWAG